MATLTIRNLNDSVKQSLRLQSANNGRSMEAEARVILTEALQQGSSQEGLATQIRKIVEPVGGIQLTVLNRDDDSDHRIPNFSNK